MKELIFTVEAETKENGEQRFTPKTIVNYYLIAAAVFATAKDRKGKQLFPRQWDLNYIGLPAVDKKAQNTPTFEAAEIETILASSKERFRVLYCFLAGSGLRIAEALGLEIGKHFSIDCSIVYVRQQRSKKGHKIEPYPKTDAGIRDVDLHPDLAALRRKKIRKKGENFFLERSGRFLGSWHNITSRSCRPL